MFKHRDASFIVARKISRRMLRLYLALYLLTMLVIALLFIPVVFYSSYNSAINTTTDVASNLDEMQSKMQTDTLSLLYTDVVEKQLFSNDYANQQLKQSTIELELEAFVVRNPSVLAISLVTDEGECYYPIKSYKYNLETLLNADPNYEALCAWNTSAYFGSLITDVFDTVGMKYNAYSYGVTRTQGTHKFTLVLFFNANSYMKINERMLSRGLDACTVLDRNGNLIYSTNDAVTETIQQSPPFFKAHISGTKFAVNGVYFYSAVNTSGWRVVCFASYITLAKNALLILLVIAVFSLLAPITYSRLLDRTATDELMPIKELSSIMSGFHIGQNAKTDIQTGDEIEDMCAAFNAMVSTINQQAMDIRAQEKQNAMVLYKLLVTQIDPHFIYNTMNIINIMARNGEDESIIEINSALIKILRERLSVKLSALHTIEEEIDTLEQYKLIMRYRFSDYINTYISVAPELLQMMIPKNILQPLVENAFYHGYDVQNAGKPLDVDVMIYSQDHDLVIEISDNGRGMSQERLRLIQENSTDLYRDEKPHIGIDNVRQRIAYLYGERASMQISSELNMGTNIVIILPLQSDECEGSVGYNH